MFPNDISDSPLSVLWHFATGYLPDFLNRWDGAVGWVRWPHRGVQFLDRFEEIDRKSTRLNSSHQIISYAVFCLKKKKKKKQQNLKPKDQNNFNKQYIQTLNISIFTKNRNNKQNHID